MEADIVTIPLKIIHAWIEDHRWMPDRHYRREHNGLKSIIYEPLALHKNYIDYEIKKAENSLLDEGLKKFVVDWNNLLASP